MRDSSRGDFQDFVTNATSLYRQLFMGIVEVYDLLNGGRMYFKDIAKQIKDRSKNNQIPPVDWEGCDALSTLRLNSKVRRYNGFETGRRVFGRTPKMLIAAVCNTFCNYIRIPPILQSRRRIV